ncbi:MAG: ATPase [Myxococcales bacterium]
MRWRDDLERTEDELARLRLRLQELALARTPGMEEALAVVREEREAAEARIVERRAATPMGVLALDRLAERFGLSPLDEATLLTALAPALDHEALTWMEGATGGRARGGPTVDLVLALWTRGLGERVQGRARFAEGAPLLRNHLITLGGELDPGASLLDATIRLPDRLVGELLGQADGEDAGARLLPPTPLDRVVLGGAHEALVRGLLAARREGPPATVLLFAGPSGVGKTLLARAVAGAMGLAVLAVEAPSFLDLRRSPEERLADLLREARLRGAALLLDDCESVLRARELGGTLTGPWLAALDRFEGTVLLTTTRPALLDEGLDRRVFLRLDLPVPDAALRRRLWQLALADAGLTLAEPDLDHLALRYDLAGAHVRNAVAVAAALAAGRGGAAGAREVDEAARLQVRRRPSPHAEDPGTLLTLDDLVLPSPVRAQIEEILAAARNRTRVLREWGFAERLSRGLGIGALFDGEPGTGKTQCAEILAAELGMPLHRVNVAQVLDKYVGETEKNLARVFAEARAAGSLLLFDEADALFASRVNVESGQDRHANLEINLLLQLMERHEGIVVLTTNLKQGIDKAFERRIGWKVHFPFPDATDRERIWRALLPSKAPAARDIDFHELAFRFELSGGGVKNAVLRAAYRAAAGDRPINMGDLEAAAEHECAASGKLYKPARRRDEGLFP